MSRNWKSQGSHQLFLPTGESEKLKEVKRKNSKGFQPLFKLMTYIGDNLSIPDLAESKRIQRRRTKECSTLIQLTGSMESCSGRQSPVQTQITGSSLAIMKTDGKSFWFLSTDIVSEDHFTSETILNTRDRNLSAILQTIDGKLIVSFFDTAKDGTVTERSYRITLPVETSLRSE